MDWPKEVPTCWFHSKSGEYSPDISPKGLLSRVLGHTQVWGTPQHGWFHVSSNRPQKSRQLMLKHQSMGLKFNLGPSGECRLHRGSKFMCARGLANQNSKPCFPLSTSRNPRETPPRIPVEALVSLQNSDVRHSKPQQPGRFPKRPRPPWPPSRRHLVLGQVQLEKRKAPVVRLGLFIPVPGKIAETRHFFASLSCFFSSQL